MRLSIFLTSMDVIRKEYGLVVKLQKMNQEGHSLKIVSSGKGLSYEQNLNMTFDRFRYMKENIGYGKF